MLKKMPADFDNERSGCFPVANMHFGSQDALLCHPAYAGQSQPGYTVRLHPQL